MHIVVMRHGQAENFASSDAARNLTSKGIQQATLAGQTLNSLSLEFDDVWVSPYKRTQQTADRVLQSVTFNQKHTKDNLTPDSDVLQLISVIESSSAERLLIVSHQPLVSELVSELMGRMDSDAFQQTPPMSPASMAFLTADELLSGCCHLRWLRHAPTFEATI